jgi:hypothetical protein
MTFSNGFRRAPGGLLRAVTPVAIDALNVIASRSAGDPSESLPEIAAETLGDGSRCIEIFNLNKELLVPDGGERKNPHVIGPRPVVATESKPPISGSPDGPVAAVAATAGAVLVVGGALAFLAAATLAVAVGGRHRNDGKRRPARDQAPESRGRDRTSLSRTPGPADDFNDPWTGNQDPYWPGGQLPAPQDDFPGWPGDQPRPRQDFYSAPTGSAVASRREPPPAQYPTPWQQAASHQEPILPTRVRSGDGSQPAAQGWDSGPASSSGPMRPYNPPTGPMGQYNPPSRPTGQYNPPTGPMRQYSPPSGPMPQYNPPAGPPMGQYSPPSGPMGQYNPPSRPGGQYNPPSGPMPQYNLPPGPMGAYDHPSGPMPQYNLPPGTMGGYNDFSRPTPQYEPPAGPMHPYDPPSGPMGGYYSQPSVTVREYNAPTGPMHPYDPPSAPMGQYGQPSVTEREYGYPSGGMHPYDQPAGTMVQYGAPSGRMVQYAGEAPAELWTADSVRLANQILSTATQRATEVRNEATASLAGAQQEAADLLRRASDQAAATRLTAEQEAEELRAAVLKLSADLGGMAAYVTENLLSPAPPAVKPAAQPTTMPVSKPVAKPQAEPGTKPPVHKPAAAPVTTPKAQPSAVPQNLAGLAATPGTRPGVKPKARQAVAMRGMAILTAALVLFALTAGTTEVALHGLKFFVFRSAGTGETSGSGLQENQGPGQADAPGVHK